MGIIHFALIVFILVALIINQKEGLKVVQTLLQEKVLLTIIGVLILLILIRRFRQRSEGFEAPALLSQFSEQIGASPGIVTTPVNVGKSGPSPRTPGANYQDLGCPNVSPLSPWLYEKGPMPCDFAFC